MSLELEALDHVGLTVTDVAHSVRWYQEVLGLRRAHEEAWGNFPAVLETNSSGVALFPLDPGDPPPPPGPAAARRVPHLAARAGRGQGRATRTWVEFEERDYGVAWSIYMPDPDGHLVEITTYEVTRG